MSPLQLFLKRLIDLVVSILLIIFLAPVIIICGFSILIFNGSPVLFIQKRPGLNEKIFSILKFRTMNVTNNNETDISRTTKLGSFLRKLSLDELPQLINVIRGDLSLVGPRPLLIEYLPLYSAEQKLRHHVKPGITGWAQINGRNSISWNEKFNLDIWYVKNWSILLDFKIILLTAFKILSKSDVNASKETTMEKFKG